MRIDFSGGHITISDDSETAKKIRKGHNFDIVGSKIVIGSMGTKITNKWQAIEALKNASSIPEVKSVLIEFFETL